MERDQATAAFKEGTEQAPELKYTKVLYNRTAPVWENKVVLHPLELEPLPPSQMYGVANVRIAGEEWSSVDLVVGGHVFDRIDRSLDQLTFPMLENDCCLPCTDCSQVRLEISGKCDSVSFDVVLLQASELDRCFTVKSYQTVCCANSNGNTHIDLPFNLRVEQLIVRSAHKLENVIIEMDVHKGNGEFLYHLSFSTSPRSTDKGFIYVIDMDPVKNFSYVRNAICRFDKTLEQVHAIALSSNLFSFDHQLCGKRFSS